jgi:hypothetical protein
MASASFEFFEVIAEELSAEPSRVITREELEIGDERSPLLESLKREMKAAGTEEAIQKAVEELRLHFQTKGARLPFDYEVATGRFTATDRAFLAFVKDMSSIRSIGKRSREFECEVATWLSKRATGVIHRVGHPRDTKKKSADFNKHLKTLGFERPVLLGKEKDGGLDIMWLLPLGTIPHRPIVSVQCKNGEFKVETGDTSLGASSRSFSQHGGLQPSVHVPCVLFNDYLYPKLLTQKQMNYVPLGLSDLASLETMMAVEKI